MKPGPKPKWRRCPTCRQRKLIAEDFYHWHDRRYDRPRVSRNCKVCSREAVRARYRRTMADPYLADRERARKRTWEAEQRKRAANPGRCKRYRERVKQERPDVYRQRLEDARINGRLRRDLQGKPATTKRAVVREPKGQRLPVEPLAALLREAIGAGLLTNASESDLRAAFRVLEESDRVSVSVADRLANEVGSALSLVYPELYA